MMVVDGKSYTIKDIMRPPVLIENTATLYDTLSKMIAEKRNSLAVVSASDGTLVGAVNATDIIKAVLPDYIEESEIAAHFANIEILKKDAERVKNMPITEFMDKKVPTIKADGSVTEAASMATHTGRGRIVVIDDANKPIGVLTRTELKQVIGALVGICGDRFSNENSE